MQNPNTLGTQTLQHTDNVRSDRSDIPGMTRREFNYLLAATVTALLWPQRTQAQSNSARAPAPTDQSTDKSPGVHEIVPEIPLTLRTLDGAGTLSFIDAIVAMAREKPSFIANILKYTGLTGQPTHTHGSNHPPFPMENMTAALIMNVIRAGAFGAEVRHDTLHEMRTTLTGVGLLMGLTSLAKGIEKVEAETEAMAQAEAESLQINPEAELANSIFQMTVLSSLTQVPLTAFGNAKLGNSEICEIQKALESLYLKVYTDLGHNNGTEFLSHVEQIENPQIRARAIALRQKYQKEDVVEPAGEDLKRAWVAEASMHTQDISTLLMAMGCNTTQAAFGDAGPLIGLYQSYGLEGVQKAIPAVLPYTFWKGVEGAMAGAQRAGISPKLFLTREKLTYAVEFLISTWKNFFLYLVHAGPATMAKVGGKDYPYRRKNGNGNGSGMDFSIIEQIAHDLNMIGSTITEAVINSCSKDSFDIDRFRNCMKTLTSMDNALKHKIGEIVLASPEKDRSTVVAEASLEISKADEQTFQKFLDMLDSGNSIQENNMNALKEFLDLFQALIVTIPEEDRKASLIEEIKRILEREKPTISTLLSKDHWHEQIGPELTDTLFVVMLQGLHLPFLINTVEREFYRNGAFKRLPLVVREWLSVGLNNAISMFADNWADCVAHSKWLTTMYFDELDTDLHQLGIMEQGRYTKTLEEHAREHPFRDDSTQIIPERFQRKNEYVRNTILHLTEKYPQDVLKLTGIWQKLARKSDEYYHKSLIMSLLPAVTGGGKALTGNSPNFTFGAGNTDFTLITTLEDFKRHPLYHLWEFISSTIYTINIGPVIARSIGNSPDSANQQISGMLQEQFKRDFPKFFEKLQSLHKPTSV